jgi:hypothetical protein
MSKYIEKLAIHNTEIDSFHHFQNFTMLTTLDLVNIPLSNSDKINLTDCLNMLPDTLKELKLRCNDLEADPTNFKMNSIERFRISTKYITSNIVDTALI